MRVAHGNTEISVVDNIISCACIGSFNLEGVYLYIDEIKSIISSLKEKEFAMIIDNTKFVGCTPDAFEEMEVYSTWLCKTKLKAKAFVIKSQVNKNIILHRTPSLSSQNIAFFSHYSEAHAWVKKFL
ncbi:MAG: hypothetical protein V5786_05560 [Psychromonas sp.]